MRPDRLRGTRELALSLAATPSRTCCCGSRSDRGLPRPPTRARSSRQTGESLRAQSSLLQRRIQSLRETLAARRRASLRSRPLLPWESTRRHGPCAARRVPLDVRAAPLRRLAGGDREEDRRWSWARSSSLGGQPWARSEHATRRRSSTPSRGEERAAPAAIRPCRRPASVSSCTNVLKPISFCVKIARARRP